LIGLLLIGATSAAGAGDPPAGTSKHIAKILAAADGATEQSAYKVSSVHDEYQIIAALRLTPKVQSLVIKKKPYDVIEAADETGATRKIWFDISSFYPEF
jgi:hypothetical protein